MGFLFKLFINAIKKSITSPLKSVKNLITHPLKSVKKRITAPVRSVKSQIKKGRRLGRFVRLASPKQRLIEDTFKKAKIATAIIDEENLLLNSKTSVTRSSSEVTKELAESNKALRGRTTDEIKSINKAITKELEGLGLDSAEKIERVVEDEQFREDIVRANSYEDFMDNWKDRFFGYKPEEMGMTEDERQAVWDQIENDRTYADFVERKLN